MKLNANPSRENLENLRLLYEEAFPADEKKPFALMLQKREEGSMEFLTVEEDGGEFLGLVIMILHKGIALLDYFAISPEKRGGGIGSRILEELKERYDGKRLLLEIEDPDEPADNTPERLRRRGFYQRNGMEIMNYKVWLFGVKMLVLTHGGKVSFEEYHEIFDAVFSPAAGKNVTKV
ncbi:MAG: GNAT family N-acetyltransferase [Clostridia bacterium]|nr:GNAT family N-acetyltransferase [Clostridia bacterium]